MLRPLPFLFVALLAWCSRPLAAQCMAVWSSGSPVPIVSGFARCSTLWDPDGAGPLPQRLVIGGTTLNVGSLPANQRLLTWDGSQWDPLGPLPGTSGIVAALTVWNGQLVAGGGLGSGGANNIVSWNGSAWTPFGTASTGSVLGLTVWNGNLVAVGTGSSSSVPLVQVFNGIAWAVLPQPPMLLDPRAVVGFEGELCVAGTRGSQGVLERWNGSSWATSITATGSIDCLAVRWVAIGAEVLYAGGNFTSIGGTSALRVANTVGGAFAWSAMSSGLSSPCRALHVRSTGPLNLTLVAATSGGVTRFTSSSGTWAVMGSPSLESLDYYAGSYHGTSNSEVACFRHDGTNWLPVRGPGLDGVVVALTQSGGDMILGGTFTSTSGVALNNIARWNGSTLQPLGSGMTASVMALLTLDNGDIVAGGQFPMAGGVTVNNVARWDGSTWSPLGTGFDLPVLALAKLPNGDLFAGGMFTTAGGVPCAKIARWNGTAWSPLGTGMNGDVNALVVRGDGMLFAGGSFTTAGGLACACVARWNGAAWLQAGSGCNAPVSGLAVRPNDDIVAVGAFSTAGGFAVDRCARWDGSGWVSMGAASGDPTVPRAVYALPSGDVIAGRGFHEPSLFVDSGISRWNGSTWSAVGAGLALPAPVFPSPNVAVLALAQRADGTLVVGGNFTMAGGIASGSLATLQSACMPSAQSYGAGCSSAAGPLVLTPDTQPWIGTAFRTTTTGLAAGSLCFGAIGFAQSATPLAALLPQGQPGCTLLTSLDIAQLLPSVGGIAQWHFPLPPDVSLIGVNFFEQSIVLELNGAGALAALRSSNGVSAIIGTL